MRWGEREKKAKTNEQKKMIGLNIDVCWTHGMSFQKFFDWNEVREAQHLRAIVVIHSRGIINYIEMKFLTYSQDYFSFKISVTLSADRGIYLPCKQNGSFFRMQIIPLPTLLDLQSNRYHSLP